MRDIFYCISIVNSTNPHETNKFHSRQRDEKEEQRTYTICATSHHFSVWMRLPCRKSFSFNNLGCRMIRVLNIKKVYNEYACVW